MTLDDPRVTQNDQDDLRVTMDDPRVPPAETPASCSEDAGPPSGSRAEIDEMMILDLV